MKRYNKNIEKKTMVLERLWVFWGWSKFVANEQKLVSKAGLPKLSSNSLNLI